MTARKLVVEGIKDWPEGATFLPPGSKKLKRYENLRKAIGAALNGTSFEKIKSQYGVSKKQIYTKAARSKLKHRDGNALGHRALLLNQHSDRPRNYKSQPSTSRTRPGEFVRLLREKPNVQVVLENAILHGAVPGRTLKIPNMSNEILHRIFLQICLSEGVAAPHFPFNNDLKGKKPLLRFASQVRQRAATKSALIAQEFKDEMERFGSKSSTLPYEKVEGDGYWLDINWKIAFPGAVKGTVIEIEIEKLWIFAIIEKKSTSALGYSICTSEAYNFSDVIRAASNSLCPWERREMAHAIKELQYNEGDCMPSGHDFLSFICFDELHLDNALSHLTATVATSIQRTTGATLVFGPRATPNARPSVEGTFGQLQRGAFDHWKKTGRSIPIELVLDAIDLTFAAYNNCRAGGSTSMRWEILRDHVLQSPALIRRVRPQDRDALLKYDVFDTREVGLDKKTPVIRWKDARYYGAGLVQHPSIVGELVGLWADSDDPREIECILMRDGTSLGELKIEPKWEQAHRLASRAHLKKLPNGTFSARGAAISMGLIQAAKSSKLSSVNRKNAAQFTREIESAQQFAGNPGQNVDQESDKSPIKAPKDVNDFLSGMDTL